jgi:DNA-binding NarL/FixJ family response regulator
MAQCPTRSPLVLLIAEARPTVAAGLRVFLADIPGTQPVAIMTGFDQVVDYAENHEIGLIIVGQGTNWATPLSEFRRLRQKNPTWRLVLLADVSDRDTIMAALSAGASGIIPTSVEEHELHSAITRILAGTIYIPNMKPSVEQQDSAWPSRGAASQPQPLLTERQLEVLGVLAQGCSNKQIARILSISESTVSMHLNAAFQALGVHNRTSAAMAYGNMVREDHEARYDRSTKRNQSRSEKHMAL